MLVLEMKKLFANKKKWLKQEQIQIENQVSDAKQCGHQDGKVTVPHEDFLAKINAIRYAFFRIRS
jgi:isocitrate lyase